MRPKIKDDIRMINEAVSKGESSYAWTVYVTPERLARVMKHLQELANRMQGQH